MKNTTKWIAALLALCLCVSLAACGKNESETDPSRATGETVDMGGAVGERGDYDDQTQPAPTEGTAATEEPDVAATEAPEATEGTEATGTAADPHNITLEQFDAMTAEEQEAFADTFPSFSDFVQWLRELRGQNGEDDDVVYIDDETIDLGEYTP